MSPRKSKKKGRAAEPKPNTPSKRSIKSSLLNFLKENTELVFNYKQIAARLELHAHAERDILLESITDLLETGYLEEIETGKYKPKNLYPFVEGVMDIPRPNVIFVLVDGWEKDIMIPQNKCLSAMHGDKVKVKLTSLHTKGKRPSGEVVEVLSRARNEFTGTIQIKPNFAFLVADFKKMHTDIFIPISKLNGATDGQKVQIKVLDWGDGSKNPMGEVVKVLGKPGEHLTEMNTIIAEFQLPEEFPLEVIEQANAIPTEITEEEIAKRRDFRAITTFTIDPYDAKDFDDALSIQKLSADRWEIGIHIADVSHYLVEDSVIDKEAQMRGTSVYLVDRVIPMLPENLSNYLCSLRPDEDKLAFSAVFEMNGKAEVLSQWFGRTVIRSIHRFSYEDAQEVLESGKGAFVEELNTINNLALILQKQRFKDGAISFETDEVKFKLDENGKPIEVVKKIRKEAHKLIEEFMLLANRSVAEYVSNKNKKQEHKPFVYRVHESPDVEKLNQFAKIANQFGYQVNFKDDKALAQSFNKLLADSEGKPEQNMLQNLAIRTMSKAYYTTGKTGHYGLAFQYYTHFTSPIRRYPDVMAHRLLADYLSTNLQHDGDKYEALCKRSSEMEIRASDAERASIKYKQVEYMSSRVGEQFQGIISGVTEWGIYVELLESKCEGMVRTANLKDDHYMFDENRYLIKGYNTGKVFRLGDVVLVTVEAANLAMRTIDFQFV